ncbi:MAG: hypothetical protein JXQ99_13950 [Hyphomicrobiaceae bacterium]
MKSFRVLMAGLAMIGLWAGQAVAQSSFVAGMTPVAPATNFTKVQFKLPFGMSAKKVRRILGRDGYNEIVITYIGIIDAKADACRNGIRYRVKVRANGSYEYRNEIGKCRDAIKAADVRDIIRKEGFRRIDIQDDGKVPYIASGCRQGDRYDITVNEFGDVKVGRRIGSCRNRGITADALRAALRKEGFDRIKFVDRRRRSYIVEACRNGRRLRLDIANNQNATINDRQRIGRCASAIRSRDLADVLIKAGFNRVDIVDDKLPRYKAEACRGNDRMRIAINRWGERINERKIGNCQPPATVASLTEDLRNNARRFKGISVRVGRRYPFVADVCDNGQRRELYFSKYGQIEGKRDRGRCDSPRMEAVLDKLRDRGFRGLEIFVEGCRRSGRRVRIKLDEYGNQLDRERIGRCR